MSKSEPALTQCPIACTLERVGDGWTFLILRDASRGLTRFDQFQSSLGVAPNILTKRLGALVDNGLLEKRAYSSRPLRYDYLLTAMLAFGARHFAAEGASGQLVDRVTGRAAEPVLVDRVSGKPITATDFIYRAGPQPLDATPVVAERPKG
jgi:DNA-binding HxlR family transcriptional regulator